MIELIVIIVVVGILAAVAIPRVERNGLIEAADQLSSHIRYTQQLAMNDNKFNATDPNSKMALMTYVREYFARVKVFVDIIFKKEPMTYEY